MTYEAACQQATIDQGLMLVVDYLRDEGFPVTVEQTGGFCMVATVYSPTTAEYIGITTAENGIEGDHLVYAYDGSDGDEGTLLSDAAPIQHVADYVRGFLRVRS